MSTKRQVDRSLLITTLILVSFGILIFLSASLGLLARGGPEFQTVVTKQIFFALLGLLGLYIFSRIDYNFLKRFAIPIFSMSFLITLLVFIPGVGIELGGAKRWISAGPFSFQPVEFLKLGFIIYFAAWVANARGHIRKVSTGFVPMLIVYILIGTVLLAQPNTGLLIIIYLAGTVMFMAGGGKWKHIFLLILIAILGLGILAIARPYVKDRLVTYFSPNTVNPLAEGYQIRQSLIAIGSGELVGRGFGQSVQKFNYLPEAIGDSIFAVLAEESGFLGASGLIIIYLIFALIGLRTAQRAPDSFGRLLSLGIVILFVGGAYFNIGAMLGLFPISGIPIPFVSQGGTALFFALVEAGILLNISKYRSS